MIASHSGAHVYDYAAIQKCERTFVSPDGPTLPFLYPPVAALAFVPFSFLSYKTAFVLFLLVNLGLLLCSTWLLFTQEPAEREAPWLWAALAFCLLPVAIALMQGQISFVLLLIFASGFHLFRRNKPLLAGLVFSLALVKFQLAVPFMLVLLCWKQWRALAGFLVGAAGTVLVSIWVAGWSGLRLYVGSLLHITHATLQDPRHAQASYGMFAGDMPNLHGLIFTLTHGSKFAGLVLLIVASAGVILWACLQRLSLPVALGAAMLVSYHMQPYDLVLLLAVISSCGPCAFESLSWLRRFVLLASVALLTLPVALWLLLHHATCWYGLAVMGLTWLAAEQAKPAAIQQGSVSKAGRPHRSGAAFR